MKDLRNGKNEKEHFEAKEDGKYLEAKKKMVEVKMYRSVWIFKFLQLLMNSAITLMFMAWSEIAATVYLILTIYNARALIYVAFGRMKVIPDPPVEEDIY